MRGIERTALLLHGNERQQAGVPILAEAARILVDDAPEMRQAILDAEQLVDLFLVLDHGEAYLRVIEHELHLFRDGVLIDRHRHAAETTGRPASTNRTAAGCRR